LLLAVLFDFVVLAPTLPYFALWAPKSVRENFASTDSNIFFINFICRTKEFVSVANGSEKESIFVSRRSSSAASLSVHRLRLVG
jgi:hypothetical protein